MDKPAEMFDRDFEWAELTRFAALPGPRATLGVVSGRRRQGKTFLLDALTRADNGFMFTATETTETDALRQFGEALARYRDQPTPFRFAHWDEAVTELMRIADRGGPTTAVIDEFPFLAKASPALPSIIQRALDPTAQHANTPVRLLLCGSALSFMGSLLAGNAPLRGRAALELVVPTLDFRLAAEFWEISDPRTALLTNAIVGGTPAYRREFTQGDTPSGPDDFDDWVVRAVLNPARPLFREPRYLLAEEPELHDTALYHSVLAAIAAGNAARGGIADYLGRKSTDLAHPLSVLQDVGMITHEADAFRRNRSAYRIAEPLVTFYHAVMRPAWGDLERPGRATAVWRRAQTTFRSKVVGPHFEQVCREWARWHAAPETHGGQVTRVASGTVNDPVAKTGHEVDVATHGENGDGRETLLAIGEAKWNDVMGMGHLERLQRIRALLTARGTATDATRLQCYSGGGFTDELRRRADDDPSIELIDLDRLYHGA
ncbi:putative ATP/GTP binding protein [Streptomyces sparsogenes DSM 40356]|uniref:Putative ATP/GTP binding protein n=2 Tax=Streptomyces sparsogenes TaxID=67365 RepID=A0A1R1SSI5_9ACTN|nr:putative ATP/GTP binding protein [Streptomyces sparsogenes DSM 40356]